MENDFLGKGWSFPPEFSAGNGQVKMISNEEDIQSSLIVLLSTKVGERIMQPDFGCNLDEMLFEPLTTSLKTKMKDLIMTAIYNFEARVTPQDVILTAKDADGVVEIEISYLIKATNSRYNLVYPFYLTEGRK